MELARKKSHGTTVQILMFYFFLFYRLSQSTKLHPRVLITSIAKTQRGKFSRESHLYYARPLLGLTSLSVSLCFCISSVPTRFTLLSFFLFPYASRFHGGSTVVPPAVAIFRKFACACRCVSSRLSLYLHCALTRN